MSERPIIFNGDMVRAILDGRKTQTRRVVKPQPELAADGWLEWKHGGYDPHGRHQFRPTPDDDRGSHCDMRFHCPYGQPGDRIWVRETFVHQEDSAFLEPDADAVLFRADRSVWPCVDDTLTGQRLGVDSSMDHDFSMLRWRPSIHMPRWASRLTLEVTGARVERVQEIRTGDIEAEGLELSGERTLRRQFVELWDTINGRRGYSWESNPFVWVIEFTTVQP